MSLLMLLVLVAGLTILMVVFARLVMVETRITRSYSEIAKAELMADAGLADARQLLLELFSRFPDSCTFWDPAIADTSTPGTVFMYRDIPANEAHVGSNGAAKIYACPLISGVQWADEMPGQLYSNYASTLSANATSSEKSININAPKGFNEDTNGWVGKLPDASGPTPIQVPWVEVKDDEGNAVGRYAFWIEDESFKLNVNVAKAALRGNTDSELEDGKLVPRPSLRGLFDEPTSTAITAARDDLPGNRLVSSLQVAHADNLSDPETFGGKYKFLLTTESSGLDISRAGFKRVNINSVAATPFEGVESVAYGNSRQGPDLEQIDPNQVRDAISRIRLTIEANSPNFAQRFYRNTANATLTTLATSSDTQAQEKNALAVVSQAHAEAYLLKLAVNIFDFVTPTVNPTIIQRLGNVRPTGRLHSLIEMGYDMDPTPSTDTNPIQAIGRKDIPYLSEYVWSVWVSAHQQNASNEDINKNKHPIPEDGVEVYDFTIDHYFELLNLGGQALSPAAGDLGPEPYIILENQPFISSNNKGLQSTNDIGIGRPFKIKLDDEFLKNGNPAELVFEPGKVTVITTDPNYAQQFGRNGLSGKNVYVATTLYDPVTENRVDQGLSTRPFPEPLYWPVQVPNVRKFRISSYDTRSTDFGEVQISPDMEGAASTKYILGNRYGLLDAAPSLALRKYQQHNCLNLPKVGANNPISSCQTGGTSLGSWDPRTKLDALDIRIQEQGSTGIYSSLQVGTANLGAISPPTNTIYPSDPETFTGVNSAGTSAYPLVGPSGRALRGIGDLGGVTDPVLLPNVAVADRSTRRGGGVTLTIGQADLYWDGTRNSQQQNTEFSYQTSPSREWTAWRLADVFTVKDDEKRSGPAGTTVDGLYNPNGIHRDGGFALRCLVEGLVFGPATESDPLLANQTLVTEGAESRTKNTTAAMIQNGYWGGNALARYLAQRLNRNLPTRFSPLWETGEISQLQMFSPFGQSSGTQQIRQGATTNLLNDRGREEIIRRVADLITTRGNTFTVYVVGQSLGTQGRVGTTLAKRVTVRLHPLWQNAPNDDFSPTTPEKRFSRPDQWEIEILSTENS